MSSEQQQNHSIQALLNQIARGCHKSAQQHYQNHHRALNAFIRLRVGNDEAAEELVNDTFMFAFRKPHRFVCRGDDCHLTTGSGRTQRSHSDLHRQTAQTPV
jgi:hypothetical protein